MLRYLRKFNCSINVFSVHLFTIPFTYDKIFKPTFLCYYRYALYEVKVNSLDQVQEVQSIAQYINADVWSYALPGREGLIMVAKEFKETFENALRIINVEYKIDSSNIKE